MKFAITGGAGFIGSNTHHYFSSCGDELLVIDKKQPNFNLENFIQADISDQDIVYHIDDFKPDCIINFASQSKFDHYDSVVTDVLGTTNILNICKKKQIKLCHISTQEVYGPYDGKPSVETDKLNPVQPSAAIKASSDLLIKSYYNRHKTDYIIIRLSNNYGYAQNEQDFLPKLINSIIDKKSFHLEDVQQKKDFIYVEDTSKIIRNLLLKEKKWKSIYNVGSGQFHTNLELTEQVIKAYKKITNKDISFDNIVKIQSNHQYNDQKYLMSIKKLHSHIKVNYTDFHTGILKTVKSYVNE